MSDQWRLLSLGANPKPTSLPGQSDRPGEFAIDIICSAEIGREMITAIREAEQAAREPLTTLELGLQTSDAAMRLGRLQAALSKAHRDQAGAKEVERDALRQARQALGDGDDPAGHEAEALEAKNEQQLLGNRIVALTAHVAQAERSVDDERRRAMAAKRAELRAQALADYQHAEAGLLTVLHIHLRHVLLANAAVEATKLDPSDFADVIAAEQDAAVRRQLERSTASSNGTTPASAPTARPVKAVPDVEEVDAVRHLAGLGIETF